MSIRKIILIQILMYYKSMTCKTHLYSKGYQSKREAEDCWLNPKGSLLVHRSNSCIYTRGLQTSYMQGHMLCQASWNSAFPGGISLDTVRNFFVRRTFNGKPRVKPKN